MKRWFATLRRDAWIALVIAAVLTALMMAFRRDRLGLERTAVLFLANLIGAVCIGAAVTLVYSVAVPSLRRAPVSLERRHWALRLFAHSAAVGMGTALGVEAAVLAASVLVPQAGFGRAAVLSVALPVSAVVTAAGLAFDAHRTRTEDAELRRKQTEHQLLRAELDALRARVEPHFLFNSLNTVANLIEEDPVAAGRAVLELSALFRYTLESAKKAWVPLRDEVEAARRYLTFARHRFEERLRIEVDVANEVLDVSVPSLVLQPLVENAVAHGVASRRDGGVVRIVIKSDGNMVDIRIEDDGPGPNQSRHVGSRTTATDLAKRLLLMYGDRATFETARGSTGGFVAKLTLPKTGERVVEPQG